MKIRQIFQSITARNKQGGIDKGVILLSGGNFIMPARIQIRVWKQTILDAYRSSMENDSYTGEERDRYMSYAISDMGGWLEESLLSLLGISETAYLLDVDVKGAYVFITYDMP
jgi:hypothetical protein